MQSLPVLLNEIQACTICKDHLPFEPRPVVTAHPESKIVVIGQAPGMKVQLSGTPWDDASGQRLREWLDIDADTFYDTSKFAIIPMGFCYPGKGKSGDLPPRKECAPQWHEPLYNLMPNVKLTLLIGAYAQHHYLGKNKKRTLTETVNHFDEYLPDFFPLVHPSPLNFRWLRKNPWFEKEVIPMLRKKVRAII